MEENIHYLFVGVVLAWPLSSIVSSASSRLIRDVRFSWLYKHHEAFIYVDYTRIDTDSFEIYKMHVLLFIHWSLLIAPQFGCLRCRWYECLTAVFRFHSTDLGYMLYPLQAPAMLLVSRAAGHGQVFRLPDIATGQSVY